MQPKAKTMTVGVNTVVAPPYIHRYTEDSKTGWRIQPTGYVKCFLDENHGGAEQALEVAKAALRVLATASNSDLLQIYDPKIVIRVKTNGHLNITLYLPRGMHSSAYVDIPAPYYLDQGTIKSMGQPWVGQKVYEFTAKTLPSWFPVSCRQTAFQAWKKEVQSCALYSAANTPS